MSDQGSQGSVSGSGYDGAFADSLLRSCDEEAASLQHVLGGPLQVSGWTLGARLGEMQPGGADTLLLPRGAVNAGVLPQHGGVGQFAETSGQEPLAYVRQSTASQLQPGPCDPAFFSTGSPDVHWASTSSNHASQGLGPVKQLSFGPALIHANLPLETTPQSWLQPEKHLRTSHKADLAATPLSQNQLRSPSLDLGWSLQYGSFSQAQRYNPVRQHLVAPKTGVATSPENRIPIWQHEGSHVQSAAFTDVRGEQTPRSAPQTPIQKDNIAAGRQPQHAKPSLSSAPQGRHYMSATSLSFQGHPSQVSLQPLRDQAEHLLRNRLVHQSAHRFEGGRIGRRWEKQENREKKLHAQSPGPLPLSSPPPLAPDLHSLPRRQQAPPRPPGLRLNALFQDSTPAIPKPHHANLAVKQAHATELRYSSPEVTRQGPPVPQFSQRSDRRAPLAQTGVPAGDALWQSGVSSLQNQQGPGHSAHWQPAEESLWSRQQAPVVTVIGAKEGQGPALNLGDRSHNYVGGQHSQRLVSGQDMDVGPHWHAVAGRSDRGPNPDLAHVAGAMHSQMQPSTHPAPQIPHVPQERGQKDSFGADTPATRALQSQLSSTQRALGGAKHGVWRSTHPAGTVEDLSGPEQRSPVQNTGALDTAESSAEHVPSQATRQRGRAPRKAVRKTTQGGTPEKVELVGGHAAVPESSLPLRTGAPQGWLGYSDGTGVLGIESHHELFPKDDWEVKPVGEQGLEAIAEAAEYEAVDQYPMGRFSRASAKFDQALGFENVDEFGNEVSEGKKRPRGEAESETERAAYVSSVEALSGTNAAARSRIACELEKQAIILALEEGHVVKRIKLMGILSGSAPRAAPEPAASLPSGAVCPHAGPGPARGDADVVSENGGPFLTGPPVSGTEMPGLQPVVTYNDVTGAPRTGRDTVNGGDGSEGHVGPPQKPLTSAVPTAGAPFSASAQQDATPFDRASGHFAVPSDPGQPTAHFFADVQDAMSDSEDKENIRPKEDTAASDDMDFETDLDQSPPQQEQSGNASPVLLTPSIGEGLAHSVGNVVLSYGAGAAGSFAEGMVLQRPVTSPLGSSEEMGEDDPLLALQPAAKRHKAAHLPQPVAPSTPAEVATNAASVFGASPPADAWEKHDSPPLRSKVVKCLVSHPLTPPKSSFPSFPSPAHQTLPVVTRRSSVSSRTPSPPGVKAGGVPSPKSSPDRMRPALCSAPYNLGSPTKSREGRGPFSSPQKTSPGRKTIPSPAKSRNSTASPPKKGSKGSGPSSSSSRSMGPSPPKSSPAKMARLI
ncbi:hypothetical protein KFL_004520070 [Klebsormidium nitens]|uniref:Uncharacterized protein n=1 Tax=Klebsormidium nitens TaxID=105231 RepID=A0A1Y1ICN9_KLENI|nr:hypothetical protein KFL_004520070 [Klebsormidium nitens]|eukprot:GAQ88690.1 hypothetical protein KFL_004520070 [Klebsormidium nitens]